MASYKLDPTDLKTYPPLKSVAVNGISLRYQDISPPNPKDTIVFVHGFPNTWFEWKYSLKFFVEKGYRVIAVSKRGYNGNEPRAREHDIALRNKTYNFGIVVKDLKDLLDHLQLPKIILCAHDWGSVYARMFVQSHPEYVKKLILISIPYFPPPQVFRSVAEQAKERPIFNYQAYYCTDQGQEEIDGDLEAFVHAQFRRGSDRGGISEEMLSKMVPGRHFKDVAKELGLGKTTLLTEQEVKDYVDFYRSIGGILGPLQWYRMGEQSFEEFKDKPKYLDIKTLFVQPEYDPFSQGDWLKPMKKYVRDLKIVRVADAGHWIAFEQHAEMNRVIYEWLEPGAKL